ncbi:MAG: pitrilysin family protein [Candidatus Omnitrophica bacterium]|nr:pitrilysin family protein [Candidatus Omnitrophota bacterium]MDD5664604.1 pitrilysin family protein [Candidatus Omnitrophota bacterium]
MKMGYRKNILANGLRVVSCRMPQRESFSLGIFIKVGGRYENNRNKGMAHFLEHLLFKGSRNYSCRKIKESIEGVGGSLNGFTSEELTCYLVKMPSIYLEQALNILSDMVIRPELSRVEIRKERTVILEELKMYRDLPQSYVYELLDELLWPNQPLGAPIIGRVDSLLKVDRKGLLSFKHNYYNASNMIISAAGNIDEDELNKGVSKIFSALPKAGENMFIKARDGQSKARVKVFHKETEQTHMALGFKGFRRGHPLRHAVGLLHVILGANMSSRLFNEVREKRGLAYEIGTAVKRFYDTGAFLVHAGIDNRKVPDAISLILKELVKAKESLVKEGEFNRAKEFYIGQLKLGLEDTMEHMLWIGETTATLDKIYSLEEIINEVNRINKEDILKCARFLFKEDNLNLSLIGPLKGAEYKISERLNLS